MFDYLIVGAGFSGCVLSERLAASGKRVLLTDRRPHIGGNAYDYYDQHGVLVHKYGPHVFHTSNERVYQYLSRFTMWRPYEHRVLAEVDGKLVPFPINLDSLEALYGIALSEAEAPAFWRSIAEPQTEVRTFEQAMLHKLGPDLYARLIANYTRKHWGLEPAELDASLAARVPVRCNRDGRCYTDKYQLMPLHGYTKMFECMLSNPNITLLLQADYRDVAAEVSHKQLIYTGSIDEYFEYCFGKLPYRSLRLEFKTERTERFQKAAVVTYPNEHEYTRVTEFKHMTGQKHNKTSLLYEYPSAEGDPYYPIPREDNIELYRKYKALADSVPDVHFVGRLGTYRYLDMDQCVLAALGTFDRIRGVSVNRFEESAWSLAGGVGGCHDEVSLGLHLPYGPHSWHGMRTRSGSSG